MEIVVKGRNVEVPDHFRVHIADKLHKIERYSHRIIRVDVELFHERNPRQADTCQRVEITCASRGPVVRAEATAADFYRALDIAIAKLDHRLRRAADRRRIHRGRRAPVSVAQATAGLASADLANADLANADLAGVDPATLALANGGRLSGGRAPVGLAESAASAQPTTALDSDSVDADTVDADSVVDDQPWHLARVKEHRAAPMAVDDALFQMELVGHDFYLFLDKDSGRPSVVYRRKGYDYGVICLAA